ncbi:response regulator [Sphingomonas sp. GB1N7]|uniref:response regulator n=1 Tax=Parasphingomonas caseinilytica TaxID=3096158 RepID=UPI002FCA875E
MTIVRVLIIDDSVTMRAMLEQVISADHECQVVGVAANAETAFALLTSCRPDVITLDLTMPGIDGLQFLRIVREKRHPPIVVVSSVSRAGAGETDLALKAGASACFDKACLLANVPLFLRTLKKAARCKKAALRVQKSREVVSDSNPF